MTSAAHGPVVVSTAGLNSGTHYPAAPHRRTGIVHQAARFLLATRGRLLYRYGRCVAGASKHAGEAFEGERDRRRRREDLQPIAPREALAVDHLDPHNVSGLERRVGRLGGDESVE